MASGRVTGTACLAIQASRRAIRSACNRTPTACPTPVLGGPGFFLFARITLRLTLPRKHATKDCIVIRDNVAVSTRIRLAEPAGPVKRALPLLGRPKNPVVAPAPLPRAARGALKFEASRQDPAAVGVFRTVSRRPRLDSPVGSLPNRRGFSSVERRGAPRRLAPPQPMRRWIRGLAGRSGGIRTHDPLSPRQVR